MTRCTAACRLCHERLTGEHGIDFPAGADMPPLIVHCVGGGSELNDGNHRYRAYEDPGIDTVWAIVWITEEEELNDFMTKYVEYVKNCTVIRK